MNKEAPRTDEEIDRNGRGVFLIHQECQPRRQNGRNPTKSSEKPSERTINSTRIRLNYEPDARKSTPPAHEQRSIWEIPVKYLRDRPRLIAADRNPEVSMKTLAHFIFRHLKLAQPRATAALVATLLALSYSTVVAAPSITWTQNASTVACWNVYELTMTDPNEGSYSNPWETPVISAVFTSPSGQQYSVGGFYYNNNQYKLRFAPRVTGTWAWTLSFADTTGTYNGSGSFTATTSTNNTGFLRVSSSNLYGLVTESGSAPIYLCGQQGSLPGGASVTMTDLSTFAFSTDSFAQPCNVNQFALNSRNGGFNFFREMNQGDGFYHLTTFNSGSAGMNVYNIYQGIMCDELMQALHAAGFHIVMTMWASAPTYNLWTSGTSGPLASAGTATLRYHQYIVNRFAPYVDLWELLNEQSSVPQSYSQAITSYLSSGTNISSGPNADNSPNDPYRHLVTINFAQSYFNIFNVETWHTYYREGPTGVCSSLTVGINAIKADGGQPPMATETGMYAPYGSYDPTQFREMLWTAFLNQATLVFWGEGAALEPFFPSGNSNETVGPQERAELNIRTNLLANFDPGATTLSATTSASGPTSASFSSYALGSSKDLAAYISNASDPNDVVSTGMLSLNVPGNDMQGWWINPGTGALLQPLTLNAGSQNIPIPPFQQDIALRVQSGGGNWPAVQFSTPSYLITATNGSISLPVYNTSGSAVSVSYSMSNGLAQAGVDYTSGTGALSWGAGDTSPRMITIPLMYSGSMQATRDFVVSLNNPSTGSAVTSALVAMAAPASTQNYGIFSQPTYLIPAGSGTAAVFTVNRVGSGNGPLTIYYDTRNGGTATAGTDFTAIAQPNFSTTPSGSGTGSCVTWASGDTSPKTFTVNILDTNPAYNKWFPIRLYDGGSPNLAGQNEPPWTQALVVLLSATSSSPGVIAFDGYTNWATYYDSAASYTVSGTAGSISIPVSRTGGSVGALTGTYSFSGGTAISGTDFSANGGTISWANGDTTDKMITVPIVNNAIETGTVTTWLTLTTGSLSSGYPAYAELNIIYHPALFSPTIAIQPQNQTTTIGHAVNLGVLAAGSGLTYQWYNDGTIITGATNATYTIASAQTANAGNYTVVVTNSAGTNLTSNAATLTVNTPPAITAQPLDQMAGMGASATFSVAATGTAPLFYQWTRNGTDIAGATGASYTTPPTTAADNGAVFAATVTDSLGDSTPSNNAVLTVPQAALMNGSLALTYAINDSTSNTYTVQVSNDLATWNSGTNFTTQPLKLSDTGIVQTLQVTDLTLLTSGTAPRRFIRLEVTTP